MHSFSEYLHYTSPEAQLSKFFEIAGPAIAPRLTLENFEFELSAINEFESTLPDELGTHLNMILTGGSLALSQYYEEITRAKSQIFEKLSKTIEGQDAAKLAESLSQLRKLIKEKYSNLNEQVSLDLEKKLGDITSDAVIDLALQGAPEGTKSESQIISILKSFLNQLTEGGDPMATLSLILDIVGIFDPFGVADAINAIIYFSRGRWFLGLISLVSAAIPYGGDVFKLLKLGKNAKYAERFVAYTVKDGAQGAKYYIELIPKANRGAVMKIISTITENVSAIAAKLSGALGSFFEKYLAKWTRWIPGAENFFKNLSKKFNGYVEKINKFVKDAKFVEGNVAVPAIADLASAIKTGARMEKDAATGLIRLYNSQGKIIREFSEEMLKKSRFWKKMPDNPIVKGITTADDLVKYYNGIAKAGNRLSTSGFNFFQKMSKYGSDVYLKAKLALGREIIKMLTGGKTPEELGMSEEEVAFHGADLLNHANKKKIDEMKAQGVKYPTGWFYDSANDEDYQTVVQYQNDWAKKVGTPEVIPVLYNRAGYPELAEEYTTFWKNEEKKAGTKPVTKFGNEDVMKKDQDFWKSVAKGKTVRDEQGNIIKAETPPPSTIVNQVPDLKKTDWYQEAFPQSPNESLSLLSFDKFSKHIK